MNRVSRILNSPPIIKALNPSAATVAPMIPPISVCEELDGIPTCHVKTFHKMAVVSADKMTGTVIACAATTSWPMVVATATPKRNGPVPSAIAVTYGWLEPYRISANPDLTGVKLGSWLNQTYDFRRELKASLVEAAKTHPLYKGNDK